MKTHCEEVIHKYEFYAGEDKTDTFMVVQYCTFTVRAASAKWLNRLTWLPSNSMHVSHEYYLHSLTLAFRRFVKNVAGAYVKLMKE